jgi:head-tail adaptor
LRLDGAKTFNPGLARHRIVWQRKVVTGQDTFGGDVWVWTDVQACSAEVRQISGRELEESAQRWAEARYLVRHHFIAGLEYTDRIAWLVHGETRILDPLEIADLAGTSRVLDVIAKENIDRKDLDTGT